MCARRTQTPSQSSTECRAACRRSACRAPRAWHSGSPPTAPSCFEATAGPCHSTGTSAAGRCSVTAAPARTDPPVLVRLQRGVRKGRARRGDQTLCCRLPTTTPTHLRPRPRPPRRRRRLHLRRRRRRRRRPRRGRAAPRPWRRLAATAAVTVSATAAVQKRRARRLGLAGLAARRRAPRGGAMPSTTWVRRRPPLRRAVAVTVAAAAVARVALRRVRRNCWRGRRGPWCCHTRLG
mmetsp:Transcript_16151/g.56343  ORF Transcript_16151/g.56343 Transcript_16151/m.56343 type:complete len:236 (+) Transcript_16151:1998-2705(+)